jgi:hypothetical protein
VRPAQRRGGARTRGTFGDNRARLSTTDQTTANSRAVGPLAEGSRARAMARRALWRLAPAYARRRARRLGTRGAVARLDAELEHLRERHSEQIERLEDLTRELVLAVEALRREVERVGRRDEG